METICCITQIRIVQAKFQLQTQRFRQEVVITSIHQIIAHTAGKQRFVKRLKFCISYDIQASFAPIWNCLIIQSFSHADNRSHFIRVSFHLKFTIKDYGFTFGSTYCLRNRRVFFASRRLICLMCRLHYLPLSKQQIEMQI